MIHYTLNTSHSRLSPADEVDESAVRVADRLIQPTPQRLPEPFNDYELSCARSDNGRGLRATISFTPSPAAGGGLKRPCVEFGVVADEATAKVVWPGLESLYLRLTELPGLRAADFVAPKRPATTPWCAAMTIYATPEEAEWMADFERCVAWAWVRRVGG